MTSRNPEVSVVVPTYNRQARLRRVLAALADQSIPASEVEIVVVSDGSSDGTDEYLASRPLPNVVAVTQPNGGPAVARNHGVEKASGRLVVFVDDDVVADRHLLEQHLASHGDDSDLVVIGPMLTPRDFSMSPWVRWEQAMLYKQYDALARGDYPASARQFYTGNASVARAQLISIGGFDPRFRRAEDVELAYRLEEAGLRFSFNPGAIGYHYAERSYDTWLSNAYDYGGHDVAFACNGRAWLLASLTEEFRGRHRLVRWTTKACLRRPRLEAYMRPIFKGVARGADHFNAERTCRHALSGVYHLEYYRGMAEGLGGPEVFLDLVGRGSRSSEPPPVAEHERRLA
jgi:GT2 family glycosyltransferase